MATQSHVDSRRKYSWWWDSHISPKNSKWLQENLTDMDMKVKSMIKLLEEDADSFARRAEMYYKKRPELMKLVEEFYRAYRALAERYDHATGALRHAHKTMAEAFPNHVPFALIDDSPSGSLITDGEPRTPEMPPPIRAFAEPDDLQKDILGQSSHFHSIKKSGTFSDDSDALNGKRGLKQLNEMFTSGESTKQLKVTEGIVRQGLNFHEDESKTYTGPTDARKNGNGGRGKDDAYEDMSALRDEVSRLVSENQTLKMQIKSENDHVAKCEDEIHILQESISKVEADKEASCLQAQRYAESVSNLELEISHARENNIKLHSEKANKLSRLETIEGQCLLLEAEKKHLEIQLKNLIEENNAQLQELQLKQIEIDKLKADACLGARILEDKVSQLLSENQALKVNIESEHDRVAKCENQILSLEQSLSKSEADREDTLLLCQRSLEKISNLEMEVSLFQDDIIRLQDEMAIKHASLETAEGNTKDYEKARLRFAHAETIVPFSCLLGLFLEGNEFLKMLSDEPLDIPPKPPKQRNWRGSVVAPFAGNNMLVLYSCPQNGTGDISSPEFPRSSYFVQVLHNEVPISIPGCGGMDFCPFEVFKEKTVSPHLKHDFDSVCKVRADVVESKLEPKPMPFVHKLSNFFRWLFFLDNSKVHVHGYDEEL